MKIELVPYDTGWPHRFAAFAADLRRSITDQSVGGVAERLVAIHHIGSTSVPGLAAKDLIDIQVTVRHRPLVGDFEPFEPLRDAIEVLGYRWDPECWDQRKRFFTLDTPDGRRVVNLHVRGDGEFSQQAPLLFRDYLRSHESARAAYEATKRELAEQDWPTVDDYADAKGDTVWQLIRAADQWAARTGWRTPPTDA